MTGQWTTEPPKKDGYYWARGVFRVSVDKHQECIDLVRVIGFDIEEPEAELFGSEYTCPLSSYTHWIPIEEPELPDA